MDRWSSDRSAGHARLAGLARQVLIAAWYPALRAATWSRHPFDAVRRGGMLPLLAIVALSGQQAEGQASAWPALRVTDSLRISAEEHGLRGKPRIAASEGLVAVQDARYAVAVFDTAGRRKWKRNLRGEVGSFDALTWRPDGLWIIDNYDGQVVRIDRSSGAIDSTIDYPTWWNPPWRLRNSMPVFGHKRVLGIAPDGMLVGSVSSPHDFLFFNGSRNYDPSLRYVVRSTSEGSIARTIASAPKGGHALHVLPDGRVAVTWRLADTSTLRLTMISATGDTAYTRSYPMPLVPGPEGLAPSRMSGLVGGSDGSVWLRLGAGGRTAFHCGIGPAGAALGCVELSASFTLVAARAGDLWGYDTGRHDVRRIRVVANTAK